MWLGDQITERGIGNGISLIITVGIVARLPCRARAGVEDFCALGADRIEPGESDGSLSCWCCS
jgi:preprotein translocase subunit SecY